MVTRGRLVLYSTRSGSSCEWRRQARLRMPSRGTAPLVWPLAHALATPQGHPATTTTVECVTGCPLRIGLLPRPGEEYLLPTPPRKRATCSRGLRPASAMALTRSTCGRACCPNLSPRVTEIITDLRNQLDTQRPLLCCLGACHPLASTFASGPRPLVAHPCRDGRVELDRLCKAAVRAAIARPSALRRLRFAPIRAPTRSPPALRSIRLRKNKLIGTCRGSSHDGAMLGLAQRLSATICSRTDRSLNLRLSRRVGGCPRRRCPAK